jgi:hypothetical protein
MTMSALHRSNSIASTLECPHIGSRRYNQPHLSIYCVYDTHAGTIPDNIASVRSGYPSSITPSASLTTTSKRKPHDLYAAIIFFLFAFSLTRA